MSYPNNPPVPASITVDTTASINSGLVGFWPLTNQSGTTTSDLSTGGNDGTLVGSITWEKGEKGYASEHPSTTSTYISTGYSASGESAITVSAWIRNDGGAITNNFGKIVSQSHAGNFDSYMNKASNVALTFRINSTTVQANSADIPAIGTWFHVCFVWEQSVYQGVYVNGVESNTTTADASVIGAVTHNLFIGGTSAAPRPWDGGIQNVRIYNRAITPTEVAELYSVPWTGTDYVAQNLTPDTPIAMGVDPNHSLSSGLVGYWPLSDGSGTQAKDISGGDLVQTLYGTAVWASTSKGTAFDFNTGSDFSYSNPGIPLSTGYTISAWVRFDTASTVISDVAGADVGSARNFQFKRANSVLYLVTFDSTGTTVIDTVGSTTLDSGVWYHLVGTYDSTSGSVVYINGSQDGSNASTHGTMFTLDDAADTFYIGFVGRGSNRHDGYIQNVRVYNRALSAAEVEALYNEPWAGVVTAKSAPPQYLTVDTADSINTGLLGFWPLSDGDTTAVDLSGNANNGTQSGGVSWLADDKGLSASFDGVDDRFVLSNGFSRNQTAMTISAWVKPDVVSTNTMVYYESTNIGTQFTRVALVVNSGIVLTGGRDDDGDSFTTFAQSNTGVVATNIWQHLVAVVDPTGGGCKVYLDGENVTNTSNNTGDGFPDTDPLYYAIGSHSSNSYTFDGNIQNVRVYNRALTAAEVSRLYQDPWAGTDRAIEPSPTVKDLDTSSTLTTNLVGWWPLTEFGPQDTLAYDISGNDYHCYTNSGIQRQVTGLTRAVEFPVSGSDYDLASDTVALDLSGGYTMSAWVRHEEAGSGSNRYGGGVVIGDDTGSSDVEWYYNTFASEAQWPQLVHNRSNGGTLYGGTSYSYGGNKSNSNGRWEHHVIRYDPSDGSTYSFIDGVKRANDPVGGPPLATSGKQIRINNLPVASAGLESLQCAMQNVRIYDRVLTDAEVQTLYDDPWVGLATDSLVYAYYSAAFLQRLG